MTAPSALAHSLLTALDFLPVPSGTATLGMEQTVAERFIKAYGDLWSEFFGRETPQHTVPIAAFSLARYAVTNALYAQFIAAGGYDNPELWTPEGWAWRLRTARTQPLYWDDPRFNGDDLPVSGVSWFEAMAFARWTSLLTGENIRLPTEAEWEWAARGANPKSLYPWGSLWDASKL
ncbi:MAG: formylglycine-generating enzyme family protein, partial [Anaerolineae bacterium]|nr:formylglycine-generating enzyme family protein [Anaerolineae bacterium]